MIDHTTTAPTATNRSGRRATITAIVAAALALGAFAAVGGADDTGTQSEVAMGSSWS